MPRLRNITDETLLVAAAAGRRVDPDCVIDVPGEVESADEDADHYLIAGLAWPTSIWRLESPTTAVEERR